MVSEKIIHRIFGPGEVTPELERLITSPHKILSSCAYKGYVVVARFGVNDGLRSPLMRLLKDYVDSTQDN